MLRKRVSLVRDARAELAEPRDFQLEVLDVCLLALAMGSAMRPSECRFDSTLSEEWRTSALACSSQPRERMRALF